MDSESTTRTLVFTDTYNERDNVEALCAGVLGLDSTIELLVVDDSSPDGTGELLDRLAADEPRLTVVHRPRKLGLGSAHKLAMLHAIQYGYQRLVTMDADFSHEPEAIPRLLASLADADFVIGSRYMPGGECDYGGYRRWVSMQANRAARWLLGIRLHEFTTSFRAFRVSRLRQVDLDALRSQGYSFFMESLFAMHRAGARMAEVPIHFRDRRAGQSKIPRFEVFNGMQRLLRLFFTRCFRAKKNASPQPPRSESCYNCGSPHLQQIHARKGPASSDLSAYQCTTMNHGAHPRVVGCLECGLRFVTPADRTRDLSDLYADVVDERYLENMAGRQRTFRAVLDRIWPHIGERGRLVEVGSYCGVFLEEARSRGWEVRGIEPSRWACEVARSSGLDVHCGTLDDGRHEVAPESQDAVILWDVLEHVEDPRDLLEQAHALIRDDGVLCFSTLDMDSWFPRLMGKRWPWLIDMHIFYFDRHGLQRMLEERGFEVELIEPYCHYISVRYALDKARSLLPAALRWPLSLLRPVTPSFLYIPFRFGDIKLFVARRLPVHAPVEVPSHERVTAEVGV